MTIGEITWIDQRSGDGIITSSEGVKCRFNYNQMLYKDYEVGDKVGYNRVPDGGEYWAQSVIRMDSPIVTPLMKRIALLEKQVAELNQKLNGGFDETAYDKWIEEEAKKNSRW